MEATESVTIPVNWSLLAKKDIKTLEKILNSIEHI